MPPKSLEKIDLSNKVINRLIEEINNLPGDYKVLAHLYFLLGALDNSNDLKDLVEKFPEGKVSEEIRETIIKWLEFSETEGGHTLSLHIGKSEAELSSIRIQQGQEQPYTSFETIDDFIKAFKQVLSNLPAKDPFQDGVRTLIARLRDTDTAVYGKVTSSKLKVGGTISINEGVKVRYLKPTNEGWENSSNLSTSQLPLLKDIVIIFKLNDDDIIYIDTCYPSFKKIN